MPAVAADAPERLQAFRASIQRVLDDFLDTRTPAVGAISPELLPAVDALRDFCAGGKRLRPAFCHWGYLAAGGADERSALTAAAALELLQASALIHDDVMDRSDTRRGKPAVHKHFALQHTQQHWQGGAEAFGAAAAILLGDLALVWTDELVFAAGFDTAALMRAKPVLDAMRTELMAGQFLDVLEQARGGGDIERALRVMRYKTTAYTIERPLHLGAALADAPAEVFTAFSDFGVPLGEAFQLRDDLLGVFGDPAETGKPAGDDIREGKRTVLIASARDLATASERALLDRHVGDPALDATGLEQVRDVLVATGAVARIEERITVNRDAALHALEHPALNPAAAGMLAALALAATDRRA